MGTQAENRIAQKLYYSAGFRTYKLKSLPLLPRESLMSKIKKISFTRKMLPFVIAEIGNNHEGDFGQAKELLLAAAEAGADAVNSIDYTAETSDI